MSSGRLDIIHEIFAEDAIDHTPLGETRGSDAIVKTTEYLREAFSDHSVDFEDVVAEEDTVAVRMTQRGTHDGEFMGFEPTGREFEITGMTFFRLENGRIAERWVLPDMMGLMQQLGLNTALDSPDKIEV